LLVDVYRIARRQVAHDLVAGTDDLARHPVQGFQPLAWSRSLDDVGDTGGFDLLALLVYERAGVAELFRGGVDALKPLQRGGFALGYRRRYRKQEQGEPYPPPHPGRDGRRH